jgi:hypothetical protein
MDRETCMKVTFNGACVVMMILENVAEILTEKRNVSTTFEA